MLNEKQEKQLKNVATRREPKNNEEKVLPPSPPCRTPRETFTTAPCPKSSPPSALGTAKGKGGLIGSKDVGTSLTMKF